MFCSCLVLSFDASIVTITWSFLFVVISLWVICPTHRLLSLLIARVVYWCWCVSSYFIGSRGNIWFYSWTWCPGLNPSVKFHTLHGSLVPTGVTLLLRLCNLPRSKTGMVGPSLPDLTIAPCVDSLLCYRLIKRPKSILQDSPKI
jgi:hypothetical protein